MPENSEYTPELLEKYKPYLQQINPDFNFDQHLNDCFLFKTKFAQPVVETNHSRLLPEISTPLDDLFWAGIEQVYPYDRGINYAVKIGRQAAKQINDTR